MTTISLDNQLRQYWPLLPKEEKQSILSHIKSLLKSKDDVVSQRLTMEQYNKEIEEAEKRMDAGLFTSHEDVLKEAGSW